jgi:hypothetical protein
MLDLLNRPGFLALKPLHMRKPAHVIILLECVVEADLQPKKKLKFHAICLNGVWPGL